MHEVASTDFEAIDRGVQMGPLFAPWSRVLLFDMVMRQPVVADADDSPSRAGLRVSFEDEHGVVQTLELPVEHVEIATLTMGVVMDRHVDEERRELVTTKRFVPWHRVIGTERYLRERERGPEPNAEGMPRSSVDPDTAEALMRRIRDLSRAGED